MRFRKSWLREVNRYRRTMRPMHVRATLAGLLQFRNYESLGRWPGVPEPYFLLLWNGKRWWEWTVNEIAATYLTDGWWGWCRLAEDFAGDSAGLRQIRGRIHPGGLGR